MLSIAISKTPEVSNIRVFFVFSLRKGVLVVERESEYKVHQGGPCLRYLVLAPR